MLSKRQKELIQFVEQFIVSQGHSPSYKEITAHFGYKSVGSLYRYIKILEQKGLISQANQNKRSLKSINCSQDAKNRSPDIIALPILGTLQAGFLIETFKTIEQLFFPSHLAPNPDSTYLVIIKGKGFEEDHLLEGDVLIIEASRDAEDGSTILGCIHNQEMVIKKYKKEEAFTRLESLYGSVNPITIQNESLQIEGVILGVYRKTSM